MTDNEREEARRSLHQRAEDAPRRKRIQWRLGRRGAYLVVMGVLYFLLAYGYAFLPLPTYVLDQLAMPILVANFLSVDSPVHALQFWAALWAGSGVLAIITAWWPPGRDSWGFVALWAFSAVWSVLNLWGGLVLGAPRATVVGLIFAIYALTVAIVSGMPDPPPVAQVASHEAQENDDG